MPGIHPENIHAFRQSRPADVALRRGALITLNERDASRILLCHITPQSPGVGNGDGVQRRFRPGPRRTAVCFQNAFEPLPMFVGSLRRGRAPWRPDCIQNNQNRLRILPRDLLSHFERDDAPKASSYEKIGAIRLDRANRSHIMSGHILDTRVRLLVVTETCCLKCVDRLIVVKAVGQIFEPCCRTADGRHTEQGRPPPMWSKGNQRRVTNNAGHRTRFDTL